MRTYKELEAEFEEAAKKKLSKETAKFGKALYIAGNFLEDNKIEPIPTEQAQQRAAEALEHYPQEEQEAFSSVLGAYFKAIDSICARFGGGRQ